GIGTENRGDSGLTSENVGPGGDGPSIGELGEFGLIAEMAGRMATGPGTVVGIGDDAAVLAAPDGRVVATTDFLIEGRHFRRDWAGPADIGQRAAVRSLADAVRMRARPPCGGRPPPRPRCPRPGPWTCRPAWPPRPPGPARPWPAATPRGSTSSC